MSQSINHVEKVKEFLKSDDFPVPIGFSGNDYTPNSPRLYSDVLCLHYINIMSLHGCHGYAGSVSTSSRSDVRQYFTECL
jgi:Protein of unknown function (DUF3231)